jgi:putative peptide zinc metalloprotease protein
MATDAPLTSSLWYRVAPLRPRLLARAQLHRHRYRGERWYLLRDPASGRVHRFTPGARVLLAAMDGTRTVQDLWAIARRRLGEDAPTQDEVIQLLGQLHAGDLLGGDVSPDTLELFERGRTQEAAKRRRSWINPMAVRIPLWDPGDFLDRFAGLWRVLWGRLGALLWLGAVLPALALLPPHWADLTGNLADRVLQAENLLLMMLVFPVVKALHELGHATATRAMGGEVHDMGVMLLVLMPVPYVDASAASVLPSRWRRALVGAAGMAVELFVAALAFYLWLAVEPGLVRALCFNAMLVAGVSTLIFNGNPLLRYDAYYILTDLAELPNLGQRAARYWGHLLERFVLRARDVESPAHTPGERLWLVAYGLLSTAYRLFVTIAIALFVGTQFFFFGVLLALWAVGAMAVVPVVKALRHLRSRPALQERRGRALAIAAGSVALLAGMLALPLPQRTVTEGVVWMPERSIVRAGTAGFVTEVVARPGETVRAGQLLARRVDPELDAQVRLQQARVAELEAQYGVAFVTERARAEIVREQWAHEEATLRRLLERAASLQAVAEQDGRFALAAPDDLPGRYHRQGEVIGYVLGPEVPQVRVVVEQADADLVGTATREVALRLVDERARVLEGRIVRQVPAGAGEAPSRALLAEGGGRLAADPRDPKGQRTLERIFQIDVALDQPPGRLPAYGQRVHVRFELEPSPAAAQLWRALRRVFLRHFEV